ncbi:MAG: hypothetical protein JWQ90_1598 [Hydrocarboniphaga sp.]|uniref:c-type cytochrome n=1 Tax=Hydrocarboniphaga sp. TaxID=2033016 RepID=UPI00260FBAFE|nr:cytochrome c [Hydrocarboniphaga sp.]MDB5969148.1 hypothetical protein [Hydrocarboniphaga sp.]
MNRSPALFALALLLAEPAAADAGSAPGGRQVFMTYCRLCHGDAGEGDGPAAKLLADHVRPANLRRSVLIRTEKERIIRAGGAAVGRSGSMPPWGEQLSDAEIGDLLAYLSVLAQPTTTP